jgi:ribosomal protein L40E
MEKGLKAYRNYRFDNIPLQTKLLIGEPMLEKNFWKYVTTQADLKRNTYAGAKVTVPHLSPIWKEREIIKEIEVKYCRYCGAKNNAGMTTCTQCGANLR